MATHYRGERITDLLDRIEQLKQVLDENRLTTNLEEQAQLIVAYSDLAIAKAKLTALKGD